MRRALIISSIAHAVAIGWGLISFTTKLHEVPPVDSMPIDIISSDQLSKITAGSKTGEKDKPKPLVEKVAEEKKIIDDTQGKASDKKEITTASAAEPPKPVDKPPEKKPDPKPEPKPEAKPEPKETPKPAEKKPEPKVDPIAEALKKDESKKPKPKPEAKLPPPPQPPQPKQEQKFDANRIAALLDKRTPQRQAATGDSLNMAPSLGTSRGDAAQLSQSELDALRARLMNLWNPPVGNENPQELVVRIRIQLTPDGRLAGAPVVLTSGQSVRFQTARDSAIRAVFQGQPYTMLRKETYEQWKDIEVTFDPRDMFRG